MNEVVEGLTYLLGHPFEYLIHLYGRGLSYLLGHPSSTSSICVVVVWAIC